MPSDYVQAATAPRRPVKRLVATIFVVGLVVAIVGPARVGDAIRRLLPARTASLGWFYTAPKDTTTPSTVAKTNDWDADLAANAEGAGLLMAHCKSAKAFLHCSTTGRKEHGGAELVPDA